MSSTDHGLREPGATESQSQTSAQMLDHILQSADISADTDRKKIPELIERWARDKYSSDPQNSAKWLSTLKDGIERAQQRNSYGQAQAGDDQICKKLSSLLGADEIPRHQKWGLLYQSLTEAELQHSIDNRNRIIQKALLRIDVSLAFVYRKIPRTGISAHWTEAELGRIRNVPPLHSAAENDLVQFVDDVLDILFEKYPEAEKPGSDDRMEMVAVVDHEVPSGNSPLHLSVANGCRSVVKALLSRLPELAHRKALLKKSAEMERGSKCQDGMVQLFLRHTGKEHIDFWTGVLDHVLESVNADAAKMILRKHPKLCNSRFAQKIVESEKASAPFWAEFKDDCAQFLNADLLALAIKQQKVDMVEFMLREKPELTREKTTTSSEKPWQYALCYNRMQEIQSQPEATGSHDVQPFEETAKLKAKTGADAKRKTICDLYIRALIGGSSLADEEEIQDIVWKCGGKTINI